MGVPLNRIPNGLLDFFGIKSGEWGPRELSQVLTPSIELRDWYTELYAQWFAVNSAGGHAATNPGNTIEFAGANTDASLITGGIGRVPATEAWYVHEFTTSYSFAALENGAFALLLISSGLTSATLEPSQRPHGLGTMPFATGAPAAGGRLSMALTRKMFWPPGTQFKVISYGATALAGVIRGVGRISRFRV